MKDTTRRGFLVAAGAGTAAVGAAALTPAVAGASAASPAITPAAAAGATMTSTGSLVAHVSDVRSGNVAVMVGEREVIVHAPELVATLVRATQ